MSVLETKTSARFIQGNEACAEAALAAGVRFFAGYPITPSTEIAEILSTKLPQVGGKFIQMEDEIAGIGAVLGASLAGAKALTATSGPGFSLKQELIGFAAMCEIPCVIVNVQRGGPSTGLPTSPQQSDVMQARWGTHGDHPSVVLCPSSVKETFDLTVYAFNLAETLRTPVILLTDEIVAHMYERMDFDDIGSIKILDRPKPKKVTDAKYLPYETKSPSDVPGIANFGEGYHFNVTGLMHDLDGFPVNVPEKNEALLFRLQEKINSRIKEITKFESENLEEASTVLLSFGSISRSCDQTVKEAAKEGITLGAISLKTLWPFPDFIFEELPKNVKTIIVCEMNMGQVVREVERVSKGRFNVVGFNTMRGTMISPGEILDKVKDVK